MVSGLHGGSRACALVLASFEAAALVVLRCSRYCTLLCIDDIDNAALLTQRNRPRRERIRIRRVAEKLSKRTLEMSSTLNMKVHLDWCPKIPSHSEVSSILPNVLDIPHDARHRQPLKVEEKLDSSFRDSWLAVDSTGSTAHGPSGIIIVPPRTSLVLSIFLVDDIACCACQGCSWKAPLFETCVLHAGRVSETEMLKRLEEDVAEIDEDDAPENPWRPSRVDTGRLKPDGTAHATELADCTSFVSCYRFCTQSYSVPSWRSFH